MRKEDAFTGLEAAIVLIAFVVVAAVFSYVVLGAGFFTAQKSQETIYSGVSQSSSSFEVIGSIYGIAADSNAPYLNYTKFTVGLTAGGTPVDIAKMAISYVDEGMRWTGSDYGDMIINVTESDVNKGTAAWGLNTTINADSDKLLEQGEQFVMFIAVPNTATPGKQFTINLQPAEGAAYPIKRNVPAGIDKVNILF